VFHPFISPDDFHPLFVEQQHTEFYGSVFRSGFMMRPMRPAHGIEIIGAEVS
jgi:hypothetical protein